MSEWIDLTVKIKKNNLVFPGDPTLEITKIKNLTEDGYNLNQLNLNMHIGTHIDFKNHMFAKEEPVEFEQFMGKANVIRPLVIEGVVSTQDLAEKYCELRYQERILILDLKHSQKFNTKSYYDYITFDPKLFTFLKDNNISLLGADLPTFAYFKESDYRMHKDLLKSGIYLLENLTNLDKLSNHIYLLALPLSFESIDGSLVRAIAKNI
ncbi:MAG: cyclase family protein [Candidatus Izemoplasmatales bacterium]